MCLERCSGYRVCWKLYRCFAVVAIVPRLVGPFASQGLLRSFAGSRRCTALATLLGVDWRDATERLELLELNLSMDQNVPVASKKPQPVVMIDGIYHPTSGGGEV